MLFRAVFEMDLKQEERAKEDSGRDTDILTIEIESGKNRTRTEKDKKQNKEDNDKESKRKQVTQPGLNGTEAQKRNQPNGHYEDQNPARTRIGAVLFAK